MAPLPHRPDSAPPTRIGLDRAEVVVVERYARLVRLAHLVLPPALGRHRRVLLAHGVVQRSLPGLTTGSGQVPVPEDSGDPVGYAWVRGQVVSSALSYEHRPRLWPRRLPPPRALRPGLPVVWGLRFFPRAGGTEELALDRALAGVSAPARAAFALAGLEELGEADVAALLAAAGVADPSAALTEAAGVKARTGEAAGALLASREFDPCQVQIRPTDLLCRRRKTRLVGVGLVAVAASCALAVAGPAPVQAPAGNEADGTEAVAAVAGTPGRTPALDPRLLRRTDAALWADTSRVDFTAWPPRGGRAEDTELLGRALGAWSAPEAAGVKLVRSRATPVQPPAGPPRLLYAGDVSGAAVVLLHDGTRAARYAEPLDGAAPPSLEVARTDEADVTTAAALVLSRTERGVRFLLAPWVSEAGTRDLLRPDAPGQELRVSDDGVSEAVASPPVAGAPCERWPVVRLRSSARIVEDHAFLVTDLGELTAAHLSYTPLPGSGAGARQPREATGEAALAAWARIGCRLAGLERGGVRSVNTWDFAEQKLPEKAGRAVWGCTRVSTWRGPGQILVHLRTPAERAAAPVRLVGESGPTAACSRFGQHLVASTAWRAPSGRWYALAAGSREVRALTVSGSERERGRTVAVRTDGEPDPRVTGHLSTGDELTELDYR
ncbi:hypothetical protein [Streptomyces sp. NPDC058374]|uniref:hypothetical protein n=1 Tax=unclassified Streptomyces TaxID=2593676 RepID=UPI003659E5BA